MNRAGCLGHGQRNEETALRVSRVSETLGRRRSNLLPSGWQDFSGESGWVACERFFYEIQNLTPREIEVVTGLFSDHPSQSLKQSQKDFLSIYLQPLILRNELDANAPRRIREALDRIIREGEESLHQKIEDKLLIFIRKMLAGDTSFYSDNEQAAKFLHAICVQYTRTKQIRESAAQLIGESFKGCDVRRMMSVLAPLMAMAVGLSLYGDRENFDLVLLENETDTPPRSSSGRMPTWCVWQEPSPSQPSLPLLLASIPSQPSPIAPSARCSSFCGPRLTECASVWCNCFLRPICPEPQEPHPHA